ncbi:hypothetical protein [Nostoc sp.]|uniref:hypothetical protein n=1 Tax=Nostoc sp. TaxID=1180 RepID=UPI002FFAB0F7
MAMPAVLASQRICYFGGLICYFGEGICYFGEGICYFGEGICYFGEGICYFGELICYFGELICYFGELICYFGGLICYFGVSITHPTKQLEELKPMLVILVYTTVMQGKGSKIQSLSPERLQCTHKSNYPP